MELRSCGAVEQQWSSSSSSSSTSSSSSGGGGGSSGGGTKHIRRQSHPEMLTKNFNSGSRPLNRKAQ